MSRVLGSSPSPGQREEDDGDVVLAAALVGGPDERARSLLEAVLSRIVRRISSPREHVVSPSEQSRYMSPSSGPIDEAVHVDLGVGAERPGDHGALRMDVRLLRRQPAERTRSATSEWSSVSCSIRLAQQVSARVADVADATSVARASAAVTVVPIPEACASAAARS